MSRLTQKVRKLDKIVFKKMNTTEQRYYNRLMNWFKNDPNMTIPDLIKQLGKFKDGKLKLTKYIPEDIIDLTSPRQRVK